MGRLIARIVELRGLRTELEAERATDLMFVLNGHGTFQGLVIDANWSIPTYRSWLYSTLVPQLVAPGRPDPSATKNLSFADLVDR